MCLAWLVIRKMQIKTTVRYHFPSARVALIKKTGENAALFYCVANGNVKCAVALENILAIPQNVKH